MQFKINCEKHPNYEFTGAFWLLKHNNIMHELRHHTLTNRLIILHRISTRQVVSNVIESSKYNKINIPVIHIGIGMSTCRMYECYK